MLHIRLVRHGVYGNQQKATRSDVYDVAMATNSKLLTRQNRSCCVSKELCCSFSNGNLMMSFILKSLCVGVLINAAEVHERKRNLF